MSKILDKMGVPLFIFCVFIFKYIYGGHCVSFSDSETVRDIYMPGVKPPPSYSEEENDQPPRTQRDKDLDTFFDEDSSEEEKRAAFDRLQKDDGKDLPF